MMSPSVPTTLKGLKAVSTAFARAATTLPNGAQQIGQTTSTGQQFHVTSKREYPQAQPLPLPNNIDQNEAIRFSPQRNRDITSNIMETQRTSQAHGPIDITVDNSATAADPHIGPYDCSGSVSLNATMQSNVPEPFGGLNKFTHLNMPGGQWGQGIRLVSGDQHESHYTNLRRSVRENWSSYDQTATLAKAAESQKATNGNYCVALMSNHRSTVAGPLTRACLLSVWHGSSSNLHSVARYSTQAPRPDGSEKKDDLQTTSTQTPATSRKEMLKKAVKEYGSTVIVFHIGISLMSLGTSYLLVSSGLDVLAILNYIGLGETSLADKLETGAKASTFVVAYALHKVFAPVRISITLGATPFIVRFLRRKGFLKAPKP